MLLKWVGGKRQLLPELRRFYPTSFNRYIEPFLGSGAVFFDLYRSGRLDGHDVVLMDSNTDLIGCYEAVRDAPEAVAEVLDALASGHRAGGQDHYYDVRDRRFNPTRQARRLPDGRIAYTPDLAAMLIYLNRTGFNGLFRVNARGDFNVPAGQYAKPNISDRTRLMQVAAALNESRVTLRWGSFPDMEEVAGRGDFLYVDPPYAPLSRTASFTSYTASRFGQTDQQCLQEMLVTLARRGCQILLSNSTAQEIADLYATNANAQAAGFRALKVAARRAVNSNAQRRGPVSEYLITNVGRETGTIGIAELQDCRK